MAKDDGFLRGIFKSGLQDAAWGGLVWIWTKASPVMAGLMTLGLSFVPEFHVPLPYAVAAAALTFGGLSTGILRFSEWRQRISPLGKLEVLPGIAVACEGPPEERTIRHVRAGVILRNKASFSMEYFMEELTSSANSRIPPREPIAIPGGVIPPGAELQFNDGAIDLDGLAAKDGVVAGDMKFRLKYGHVGRLKYYVEKNVRVVPLFDQQAKMFRGSAAQDIVAT
jgi:hypothetical protein